MHRTQRHHTLKQLLINRPAASQEELVDALASSGIEVTQATVSRDLTSIGAVRGPDGYRLAEHLGIGSNPSSNSAPAEAIGRVMRDHAVEVCQADSLVVLRTMPAHADLVASKLDAFPPAGMVGCIAGDDTIFIATTSAKAALKLKNAFLNILQS